MLQELNIKNFAIIEDLSVEFDPGFNVLTGETGAGKSIIIDALDFILGARGDRDFIRHGEERAWIQGIFSSRSPWVKQLLLDLDEDPEEHLIITREISEKKGSLSRVNGKAVSLSQLRKITAGIIDVFAQSEGRELISVKTQRRLLDSLGDEDHGKKVEDMGNLFREMKRLEEELAQETMDESDRLREMDLLEFQIREIKEAAITEDDKEPLMERYKKEKHRLDIQESVEEALSYLEGGSGPGALELADRGISSLERGARYDSRVEDILVEVQRVRDEFREALYPLRDLMEEESSPEDLYRLEERIHLVASMERKYGDTVEAMEDFLRRGEERLAFLTDYEKAMEEKKIRRNALEEKCIHAAKVLEKSRREIGEELSRQMTREIQSLNIPDGEFYVDFPEKELDGHGDHQVIFMIKTNRGHEPKPLGKIASGGEISRVMLGFKHVIARRDHMETMVFDEIDTGISGKTAATVGKKIRDLGRDRQVIVISHLPQIVAMADTHFVIEKTDGDHGVTSGIRKLSEEERKEALARLISGEEVTEMSLKAAEEMLKSR